MEVQSRDELFDENIALLRENATLKATVAAQAEQIAAFRAYVTAQISYDERWPDCTASDEGEVIRLRTLAMAHQSGDQSCPGPAIV